MSSEKKSVLIALCVSAVMAIALYSATVLCAMAGKVFPTEAYFIIFIPIFLYAYNRANELVALKEDEKKLADYEATHLRQMPDVPITRIMRIVERQRRNSAELC